MEVRFEKGRERRRRVVGSQGDDEGRLKRVEKREGRDERIRVFEGGVDEGGGDMRCVTTVEMTEETVVVTVSVMARMWRRIGFAGGGFGGGGVVIEEPREWPLRRGGPSGGGGSLGRRRSVMISSWKNHGSLRRLMRFPKTMLDTISTNKLRSTSLCRSSVGRSTERMPSERDRW